MKKGLVFCIALLATASLLFAGGSSDSDTTTTTTDGPQYGGTFTVVNQALGTGPVNPDPAVGGDGNFIVPILEKPRFGDHEKYGPKGTNEFPFTLVGPLPDKYAKGVLIESWEVSPEKFVWKVREGVTWAADNVDFMDNRELTADDIVADLKHYRDTPSGQRFKGVAGDIYSTDKYTVVIEFTGIDVAMMDLLTLGGNAEISPPEVLEAGIDKWENQVGTGPFMFKEYVIDSYFVYEKNPHYWDVTTIDGEQYKLPFVDEVAVPIIGDEAAMIAALRTGKADMGASIFAVHWNTLDETAPELKSHRFPISFGSTAYLDTTKPPFDNRDVRRAMMIGTDLTGFQKLRQAGDIELPSHWYPIDPIMPSHTPIDELPDETRILYDYNPELAKKMLADAGYPNGFKTEYTTIAWPEFMTDAALLKDQWAKIGVELQINGYEIPVWQTHARERSYVGGIRWGHCSGCVLRELPRRTTGDDVNHSQWSDPKYDAMIADMLTELDPEKRTQIAKEAGVYLLNEAIAIPQAVKVQGRFWWPWVKNYYGESYLSSVNTWLGPAKWSWIDQDLKKEMGY